MNNKVGSVTWRLFILLLHKSSQPLLIQYSTTPTKESVNTYKEKLLLGIEKGWQFCRIIQKAAETI